MPAGCVLHFAFRALQRDAVVSNSCNNNLTVRRLGAMGWAALWL